MLFLKKIFKQEKSFFFMMPALTWQICFCWLPLFFVLQLAIFSDFLRGVSFEYLVQVVNWSHFFVIARSMLLASSVATLCLLVGYPVAYFISLKVSQRIRPLFIFMIVLPFLTNLLVQVYSWFFILEKQGLLNKVFNIVGIDFGSLLNSQFAMYLVMFHVYLTFMIMPLYTSLEKINVRLLEASLDLGASYFQTLCRIVLPLTIEGITTGFFLVYVISFGEYAIPSLLAGQKKYYVGTLISEYFFIGKDWHVGAAFTLLSLVLFLASVLFYQKLLRYIVQRLQRV